jgi:hypothetical protein
LKRGSIIESRGGSVPIARVHDGRRTIRVVSGGLSATSCGASLWQVWKLSIKGSFALLRKLRKLRKLRHRRARSSVADTTPQARYAQRVCSVSIRIGGPSEESEGLLVEARKKALASRRVAGGACSCYWVRSFEMPRLTSHVLLEAVQAQLANME